MSASEKPWTVDDPRMWKEQCRIGDVAFQHLFCTSTGKPVPDWVENDLPALYFLLSENKRLRNERDAAVRDLQTASAQWKIWRINP